MVKGFQQRYLSDVYSPVIDLSTVTVAIETALSHGYNAHQPDVKQRLLNGHVRDGESLNIRPPSRLYI